MKEEQIKKITANITEQLRDLPDDTPDRNISVVINVGDGRAYNGDHIEFVQQPDERATDYKRAKQFAFELEKKAQKGTAVCFGLMALGGAMLQFEWTSQLGGAVGAGGLLGMIFPIGYSTQAERLKKKLYL